MKRKGFTLIEMLVVIAIISTLLALLYGALDRSRKFSKRVIVFTEMKNLEAAFRQYYSHYHRWPTNELATTKISVSGTSGVTGDDTGFAINEVIGKLLRGVNESQAEANWRFNPEMIPFIEFARLRNGIPVNAFSAREPSETLRAYKVLFDTNGDHQLTVSKDPDMPNFSTNIIADIAIWTIIPGTRKGTSNEEDQNDTVLDEVVGTWDDFRVK